MERLFDRLRRLVPPGIDGGRARIAIALFLVVGASALFWASRDYGVIAPEWDGQVRGIAYSPSHVFNKHDSLEISPEQIDRDMKQLSQVTGHIRTYTVEHGMDKVPEIAARYGMTVSLGIWIGPDLEQNEKDIELGIATARAWRRNIDRVFVGNEAILFASVTPDQLNAYIARVRAALPARIKITTAEPWSTWLLNPEIGKNVDVVSVHLLPYWEGTSIGNSLDFLQRVYAEVQQEFPDKPIVIGEAGWPSEGLTKRAAEPSLANEAWFMRGFVQLAMEKGYDYYLMEGYDQPSKISAEGPVGAYWGLFDANSNPKFAFTGLLRSFPEWRTYALVAAILTLLAGTVDPRPDAARAPAGLYCDGRVDRAGLNRPAGRDRRHDPRIYRRRRSVDDLRHGAARHTGLCRDPDRRHRTRRQPVARGAAQRTVGDSRDQPARVGSRSLLQRTAGHGDGDARSSGEAGL